MNQSFKEYRAGRSEGEGGTRIMLLAACGLGGVLVLGMAGWAIMGRQAAVVPVIEADARPVRIKPENPGGMQVAGADDGANDGRSVQGMAPVAEAPAPQALRAQFAPAPRPPVAAPVAVVVAVPAPIVAAPVAAAPVAPAATPAHPVAKAVVQLAALETEAAGRAEWARLAQKMPDLLGNRSPMLVQAARDGKPVWRVRTGGFTDVAEATGFCAQVHAKGGACTLAF